MYRDPGDEAKLENSPTTKAGHHDFSPTSDDETAALQHLDDILQLQRSTSGSLAGSEIAEDKSTTNGDSTSSSTIKSPLSSRTSTVIGSNRNEVNINYTHFL